MKKFEQIDVFMPGEESKGRMKFLYCVMAKAIYDLAIEFEKVYEEGKKQAFVYLDEYVSDEWVPLFTHYHLGVDYSEKLDRLDIGLVWRGYTEGDSKSCTIIEINMSGNHIHTYDNDSAAYILMVALICHLGLEDIKTQMLIEMDKDS